MLEQNIYTLSHTSTFTLLRTCDNRILSHFLMGFLYHYTVILHMLSTFFFSFFSSKTSPAAFLTNQSVYQVSAVMKDWTSSDPIYCIKIFHCFCLGWFLQVLFPSWLNVQTEEQENPWPKLSGGAVLLWCQKAQREEWEMKTLPTAGLTSSVLWAL